VKKQQRIISKQKSGKAYQRSAKINGVMASAAPAKNGSVISAAQKHSVVTMWRRKHRAASVTARSGKKYQIRHQNIGKRAVA